MPTLLTGTFEWNSKTLDGLAGDAAITAGLD